METQIFHHSKNIIFKKPSKTSQNPSRYYNSITNLKVSTQAKISYVKNPHIIKIDLLFITSGPKSIKLLLYSIMNLNTNILIALVRKANKVLQGFDVSSFHLVSHFYWSMFTRCYHELPMLGKYYIFSISIGFDYPIYEYLC